MGSNSREKRFAEATLSGIGGAEGAEQVTIIGKGEWLGRHAAGLGNQHPETAGVTRTDAGPSGHRPEAFIVADGDHRFQRDRREAA